MNNLSSTPHSYRLSLSLLPPLLFNFLSPRFTTPCSTVTFNAQCCTLKPAPILADGPLNAKRYILKPVSILNLALDPQGESFKLQMTSAAEPTVPLNLYWDNIIPTSLAHDPIACAFAAYQCDWLKISQSCQ